MALGIKSLSSAGGWLRPLLSVLGLSVEYFCMVSDSTWTVTWFVSGKRLERKKYLLLFLSFWVQLKASVIYCCRINRSYACTSVFISVQAFVHSNICAHLYLCRCTFIFVSVFTQMCCNCTHIFTSVHIHMCNRCTCYLHICSCSCLWRNTRIFISVLIHVCSRCTSVFLSVHVHVCACISEFTCIWRPDSIVIP